MVEHRGVGTTLPVYLKPNPHFRLPADPAAPIIMIGPGTGVAPFRAFMQHREATGANGRNWLFFGARRFTHDFLYQLEWQDWLQSGVLSRIDLAFSRDQRKKIYVQHRMWEARHELFAWLQDGATCLCLRRCQGDGEGRARHAAGRDRRPVGARCRRRGGVSAGHAARRPLLEGCLLMAQLSRNETIKGDSHFLRGTIAEGLHVQVTGGLSEDDQQLTKFHGIYQQDDRDLRAERAKKKLEKAFVFMARLRVPGGVLTPAQWIAHARHGGRAWQRHAAADHAADHPVSRHHQEQSAARDPGDQRGDAGYHRGVRRREPQRHRLAWCRSTRRCMNRCWRRRARSATHLLPRSRAGTRSGSATSRSPAAKRKTNRSSAAPICRGNSRSRIAVPPQNDVDAFAHEIGLIAIVENGARGGL